MEETKLIQLYNLLESYRNVYRKLSVEYKYHDENVFFKANFQLNTSFHMNMTLQIKMSQGPQAAVFQTSVKLQYKPKRSQDDGEYCNFKRVKNVAQG